MVAKERERVNEHMHVHVRERALCWLGLYYLRLGKDQALFQNNQSTSQAFAGF